MRSNISRIAARAQLNIERHGSDITLRWVELTGGTIDAPSGDVIGAISEEKTTQIKGLVHFVGPATSGFRIYNEFQTGDAILDLDPNAQIDEKQGLTFEFGGEQWVQKELGKELTEAWDTLWGNQRLVRTILVTRRK